MFPLSCGPVLVWFPAGRSIGFGLGPGNEVIYVVGAVPAPGQNWLWDAFPSMIVEPGLDLIGVEPQ